MPIMASAIKLKGYIQTSVYYNDLSVMLLKRAWIWKY